LILPVMSAGAVDHTAFLDAAKKLALKMADLMELTSRYHLTANCESLREATQLFLINAKRAYKAPQDPTTRPDLDACAARATPHARSRSLLTFVWPESMSRAEPARNYMSRFER
jgi:hypothetical protein